MFDLVKREGGKGKACVLRVEAGPRCAGADLEYLGSATKNHLGEGLLFTHLLLCDSKQKCAPISLCLERPERALFQPHPLKHLFHNYSEKGERLHFFI